MSSFTPPPRRDVSADPATKIIHELDQHDLEDTIPATFFHGGQPTLEDFHAATPEQRAAVRAGHLAPQINTSFEGGDRPHGQGCKPR
ncbi:hypothetical protein KBC55_03395 [Patescibacteria group bacterium]|nr:hypothetical protein [Patescibacteria group bacterium]